MNSFFLIQRSLFDEKSEFENSFVVISTPTAWPCTYLGSKCRGSLAGQSCFFFQSCKLLSTLCCQIEIPQCSCLSLIIIYSYFVEICEHLYRNLYRYWYTFIPCDGLMEALNMLSWEASEIVINIECGEVIMEVCIS